MLSVPRSGAGTDLRSTTQEPDQVCGIAGIFSPLSPRPLAADVQRMCDTIRHRGPDGEGFFLADPSTGLSVRGGGPDAPASLRLPHTTQFEGTPARVALGHRRLSILDPSPAGHQPMLSHDEQCAIVYNGEIYNFVELRDALGQRGHRFTTETDTEVILAAYREWGLDCLRHFNGMWAFALWDGALQQLFCARDRYGIKPFHYSWDGATFVFASEMKAIVAALPSPPAVHDEAVYEYLALGLTDRHKETFLRGIERLPAGHLLTIGRDGAPRTSRWYTFPVSREIAPASDAQRRDQVETFRALLEDAVRVHLRSDVPVGTCLSGGLDSSTIVCIANRLLREDGHLDRRPLAERQKTFSACYEDPRFDEREFIESVLAQTGAERNYVFPDGYGRLWEEVDQLVWHQDEPFWSTSMYAQWNVMRLVRDRGVVVVLDGQGGDEIMAGYGNYFAVLASQLIRDGQSGRLPRYLRDANAISRVKPGRLLAQAAYLSVPPGVKHLLRRTVGPFVRPAWSHADRVLNAEFRGGMAEYRGWMATSHEQRVTSLAEHLQHDVMSNNLSALLRFEDRNSMAFGVESRVPFLDHRVVEYLFTLPATQKIHEGWTKWILRESMRGVLPEDVRLRRDKKGFVTPELLWLRQNVARIEALFDDDPRSARYVDPRAVKAILPTALFGQGDIGASVVWRWINLELWLRGIERGAAAPAIARVA